MEMKEYKAPKMEVIELKVRMNVLLETSSGEYQPEEPGGLG